MNREQEMSYLIGLLYGMLLMREAESIDDKLILKEEVDERIKRLFYQEHKINQPTSRG